jgi:hypothetical protein
MEFEMIRARTGKVAEILQWNLLLRQTLNIYICGARIGATNGH